MTCSHTASGRCDLCKHWDYAYPDDMGVCTHPSGPGDGTGFAVPINQAVLSKPVRARNPNRTATTCDSQCSRFEQQAR